MERDAAPAGRELDAAVAVTVFGCTPQPSRIRPGEYHCGCQDHRHNAESECEGYLLAYTTPDGSAALRDELLRRGYHIVRQIRPSHCPPAWAILYLDFWGPPLAQGRGATEEEALVRAALLALSPAAPVVE